MIDVSRFFGTVDVAAIYRDSARLLPVQLKPLELCATVSAA